MSESSNVEVVFTPAVQAAQMQRGSRDMYSRQEGDFPSTVTEGLAAFIAERDSFCFGTASRDGHPYIQHRGGPKGFLKVLNDRTLAFGDVAGNAQYISVGNLDENNRAFLFLMDYPNRRRIKIWGTAEVVEDDAALLGLLFTEHEPAQRAFEFGILAWNANCPKGITPRWTTEEADRRLNEMTQEVKELRAENAKLRRELVQSNR